MPILMTKEYQMLMDYSNAIQLVRLAIIVISLMMAANVLHANRVSLKQMELATPLYSRQLLVASNMNPQIQIVRFVVMDIYLLPIKNAIILII